MWINSIGIGNHGALGVSSERRHLRCSSCHHYLMSNKGVADCWYRKFIDIVLLWLITRTRSFTSGGHLPYKNKNRPDSFRFYTPWFTWTWTWTLLTTLECNLRDSQLRLSSTKNTCSSVCPSVCLSVCHTFFTMFLSSHHNEIFRSYYHWQKLCPCKRSRSEVKGQGHRSKPNIAVSGL